MRSTARDGLLFAAVIFSTKINAACSADKSVSDVHSFFACISHKNYSCFRALFPCLSPAAVSTASAFCATITSGTSTATNFPSRATAACGTDLVRYVSACKCGPTCSGSTSSTSTSSACTPSTTAGLVYGDFECGLAPWSTQVPDPAATPTISSPGFMGNKAFEVDFHAPSVSKDQGASARLISPGISVRPGFNYKLTFATWFDNGNAGFTGVMVNNKPIYTIDANDFGFGHWHFNQLSWTPNGTEFSAIIKFEFVFEETTSIDKIDSVIFGVTSASCGSPVPVGILPDGEFECGLGTWTLQVPDTAVTASVTGNAHIGNSAFEVDFHSPAVSPQQGVSARIISQTLQVNPGRSYYLQFYSFFDNPNAGFIGVQINGAAVYTVDARDKGSGGWFSNDVIWVPAAGVTSATINFEFLFVSGTSSVDRIDSVVFQPFNP